MSWRVSGTYLESCNCDAICPCRQINGVPGGRSTHGICLGALNWQIVEGHADRDGPLRPRRRAGHPLQRRRGGNALELDPLPGRARHAEQHRALEEIWTGRAAGDQIDHFPWAWKASYLLGVKPARIEVDHTPRRGWFRVKDAISVRISGPYPGDETVTCGIPGHERSGEEVIAEELRVDDEALRFEFSGVCGFEADFDYRSS